MYYQTRFIIVAHKNNESKRLAKSLEVHEQVKVYCNLFDRTNYEAMAELESEGNLIKIGVDPVDYLESRIFFNVPQHIAAVGFTIDYDHAQTGSWTKLWTYARKSLKVIHLKQRNRLGTFMNPRRKSFDSVEVDPYEFQRFAESLDRQEVEFDTIFRYSDSLDVFWEDLVEHRSKEIGKIESFLNIDVKDIGLKERVYTGPFVGTCENYRDLQAHFAGSKLGEYFQ